MKNILIFNLFAVTLLLNQCANDDTANSSNESAVVTTIFADDFSVDGDLHNQSADTGGVWSVNSGALSVFSGGVDTQNGNTASKQAFASFSRALTANETLTLTLTTSATAGSFNTVGWAGISLYTGGTEQFFIGSPGLISGWGIGGIVNPAQQTSPLITGSAQTVIFTYAYDTGAWTFEVPGSADLSGTTTVNLALDTLRLGADMNNIATILISDISITVSE